MIGVYGSVAESDTGQATSRPAPSTIQAPRLTTGLKSLDVLGLFRPTNPGPLKAPRRILNDHEHRLILSALKNGGTAAIVSGARPGMAKLKRFGEA